jgi:HPt (histidine-containing phosphotransfer) domain-containing protein
MSYHIPEGKLYDLTMIREIAHGNNDFIKKMMSLFIDTMPPAISEMNEHIVQSNWAGMGAVAHKIKPSIDTMGIDLLKEDIRTLERNGKDGINLEDIPALMGKVEAVIERIISDIRTEMAGL